MSPGKHDYSQPPASEPRFASSLRSAQACLLPRIPTRTKRSATKLVRIATPLATARARAPLSQAGASYQLVLGRTVCEGPFPEATVHSLGLAIPPRALLRSRSGTLARAHPCFPFLTRPQSVTLSWQVRGLGYHRETREELEGACSQLPYSGLHSYSADWSMHPSQSW